MKRLLFAITILLFTLAACGGGVAEQATPSPAQAGEKIVGATAGSSPTPATAPVAGEKMFEAAASTPPPTGDAVTGGKLFVSACAACHSQDMTQSEFITTRTNQELVEFIKVGGVPDEPLMMPPRGGSPSLTDENLVDIVVYLRSLQK